MYPLEDFSGLTGPCGCGCLGLRPLRGQGVPQEADQLINAGGTGSEGVLEASKHPLHHPICLGVVRCGHDVVDAEAGAEGGSTCRRKLRISFGGEGGQDNPDAGGTSSEGVLKASMHPLHHPIRLGVVGCGHDVVDAEAGAEGGPTCRRKLRTSVGGEGGRDNQPADPVL